MRLANRCLIRWSFHPTFRQYQDWFLPPPPSVYFIMHFSKVLFTLFSVMVVLAQPISLRRESSLVCSSLQPIDIPHANFHQVARVEQYQGGGVVANARKANSDPNRKLYVPLAITAAWYLTEVSRVDARSSPTVAVPRKQVAAPHPVSTASASATTKPLHLWQTNS